MIANGTMILLSGCACDLAYRHAVHAALCEQFHRRPLQGADRVGFSFFVQADHGEGLSSRLLIVKHIIQMI